MDERKEAFGGFIVSGSNAPCIFEFVEEAFDAIAQGIQQRIDRPLDFAVRFCRDDRVRAVDIGVLSDGITVIAFVSEQRLRTLLVRLHQIIIGRGVMSLACCDDEGEREPFLVGAGMDFTRKAAA